MDEIIEHVAAMCQGDPLQTARYLVALALWNTFNAAAVFILAWRVSVIEKAQKAKGR